MNLASRLRRLRCPSCDSQKVIGPPEMLAQLRALGMLRRDAKPDPSVILELYSNHVQQIRCPECRKNGVLLELFSDEDDWDDAVYCEVCKEPIPRERLELFPNETVCAPCKSKPIPANEDDFCSYCGGILKASASRGAGISRYRLVCTDCGRS